MSPPLHWSLTTIGRFCTYYKGGTPFAKLSYAPHGIPVLAKGDIKPFGRLIHGGTRFVDQEFATAQGFYETRDGDFLMTTRDLTQDGDVLGLLAPVPDGYLVNQGANIVRFSHTIDWRFLVYWANGRIYRAHMKAHAVGSTQIHIRKDAFMEAPLWLPPADEQRAIVHILGTLDDQIELNRRMNETLEEMERALFKSWFVDFDPVHAKAAGKKPYGMDKATASLFPDSFEGSELGAIPKGWRVAKLIDLTSKIGSGATPRGGSSVYADEGVALIRSQNVYDSAFVWAGLARMSPADAARLDGVTVLAEDVLLNITGASILRTCVVDPEVLPARVNQHVAIIRARVGVPSRFLHLHLLRADTKNYLLGMDAGASRQAVTKATSNPLDSVCLRTVCSSVSKISLVRCVRR